MAVYRVERTRDYTVMSNYHLRDMALSLKAKGLLSMFLSFPDDWDYNTRGLASICKEGVDAIGSTIKELEKAGYIVRRKLRGPNGRITDTEYIIHERPQEQEPPAPDMAGPDMPAPDTAGPDTPTLDTAGPDTPTLDTAGPDTASPHTENPYTAAPHMENPDQLNIYKSNTKKLNTQRSITHSFYPSSEHSVEGTKEIYEKREEIRDQIDYELIADASNREQIDEFVEIMLEVALARTPTMKIGRDAEYPTALVQQRVEQITSAHIQNVLDCIQANTTRVWNIRAYLLAALFNSTATMGNHYTMLVNHDLSGG